MLGRLVLISLFALVVIWIRCQAVKRLNPLSSVKEVGPSGGLDLPVDSYREVSSRAVWDWTRSRLLTPTRKVSI